MKLKLCLSMIFVLLTLQLMFYITVEPESKTEHFVTPTTKQNVSNTTTNKISYLEELQNSSITSAEKKRLIQAWDTLYQCSQSTTESITPQQATAIKPLFEINHFANIAQFLDPKNFPELPNDPEGALHKNYATQHLSKAVARLNSVSNIDYNNGIATAQFTGDNRDFGIIVNLKNNTDRQFSIMQSSLDGKTQTQIGQLDTGLNELNLHTAGLQKPTSTKQADPTPSAYSFDFYEINSQNPASISVRMMSGQQLIEFLQTLPRKDPKVFDMNGLPTSAEYLATPTDWYIVLIQNPTSSTAKTPKPDQRVQTINVSKLSGPYLLTMQINQEDVELKENTNDSQPTTTVLQTSFTLLQIMKNQTFPSLKTPLLILPKFLWDLSELQLNWMLLTTTQLATLTNFKFFGTGSFGNAFEYFKNLGCFSSENKYALCIDTYNILPIGSMLYDSPWLMGSALYQTELKHCSDISQIHSAQDAYGHIIANIPVAIYVNFLIMCTPEITQEANESFLNNKGFNSTYALPQYQLYTFVLSVPAKNIQDNIFAELAKLNSNAYKITLTNKKNKLLASKYLYIDAPLSTVQTLFVNQTTDWVGSTLPTNLFPSTQNLTSRFKITYEFSPTNNKHILLTQTATPIDKEEFILPHFFSQYPIKELYFDVYNKFNIKPFTRCFIIQNGELPEPLTGLSEQDWRTGIYMIPTVRNNNAITTDNPGALTVVFYKSDKSLLGEITIPGKFNNTDQTGIQEPVLAYNAFSSAFNPMFYLYLSTGILLQYNQTS